MKFFYFFYITYLNKAIQKGNIEIIKLLLAHEKIDANLQNVIFECNFKIKLSIKYFKTNKHTVLNIFLIGEFV